MEDEQESGGPVEDEQESGGEDGPDKVELELALRARLAIDPNALDDEFVSCPADIAYLGAVHSREIGAQLRAKGYSKRIRGLVYLAMKKRLISENGKTTVDEINAEVEQDQRVIDADEAETEAEVALAQAKANFAAVMAKKDMIVQMGATYRAEMERDPVIVQQRREARAHTG